MVPTTFPAHYFANMTKRIAKTKSNPQKPKPELDKPALTFTTPNREGRPTKYKPEYCQQIIDFMQEGGELVYKYFSFEGSVTREPVGRLPRHLSAFARHINVTTSTLDEWCHVHPEFSEAYKKAKQIQLEQMIDGSSSGVLQAAPTIFALKNMHRWTDKTQISGPNDGPIQHQDANKTMEWMSKLSPEAQEEIKNAALSE